MVKIITLAPLASCASVAVITSHPQNAWLVTMAMSEAGYVIKLTEDLQHGGEEGEDDDDDDDDDGRARKRRKRHPQHDTGHAGQQVQAGEWTDAAGAGAGASDDAALARWSFLNPRWR